MTAENLGGILRGETKTNIKPNAKSSATAGRKPRILKIMESLFGEFFHG